MRPFRFLNSYKYNPYYPKHFLKKIVDGIITLLKILIIALTNPKGFIKQFSIDRINILLRALNYETPKQISKNLIYLLQHKYIETPSITFDPISKEDHQKISEEKLTQFLDSDSRIKINSTNPSISIIIILFNKANLTYACLKSIEQYVKIPFQLIFVDNNSTDNTKQLLSRIDGAEIIFNKENLHFLKACNQAIEVVTTPYILFLNNDIEFFKDSITSVYNTLKSNDKFGAVGGKIIGLDGSLLEAGSIIWEDGSCHGYGRDQSPDKFEFSFNRVVDYCSGSFIITRTELFRKHGGFDEQYVPAYYEESDYCMWLQKKGYKCIYDSNAVVRHVEFGSSDQEQAVILQTKNQLKFYHKHQECLKKHYDNNNTNIIKARFAASQQHCKKVLYVDDRIPHRELGAGFTRSNEIVNNIQKLGYQVTIFPMHFSFTESWDDAYSDLSPLIEIIKDGNYHTFKEFIKSRPEYYDIIWVSRPHNMDIAYSYVLKFAKNYKLIYDAEAIFSERMKLDLKLQGIPISNRTLLQQTKKEVNLAMNADVVVTVSIQDAKKFYSFSINHIRVLGHSIEKRVTNVPYSKRKDLLFVGNLDIERSPNVDSIKWFVNNIFPLVKQQLPDIKLNIIGSNDAKSLAKLKVEDVTFLGRVDSIQEYYDQSRVFIAPTRFAAGIPYKIHEAAANGIPCITTKLLGLQLNWDHRKKIMVSSLDIDEFADTLVELYQSQELWERIQKNAYHFVEEELSESYYEKQIIDILNFSDTE